MNEQMTKKELLAYAKVKGIKLNKAARATKASLLAAIKAGTKKPAKAKVKGKGQVINKSKSGGLGVAAFWASVCDANEMLWKKKRKAAILTDSEITARMNEAFPGRNSEIFTQVRRVRGRYNRGALNGGKFMPEKGKESYRYIRDDEGQIHRATSRGKKIE